MSNSCWLDGIPEVQYLHCCTGLPARVVSKPSKSKASALYVSSQQIQDDFTEVRKASTLNSAHEAEAKVHNDVEECLID